MKQQQNEKNGTRGVEIQIVQESCPREYDISQSIMIDPQQFSLEDEFLDYKPGTYNTEIGLKDIKEAIQKAQEMGMKPFYVPKYAASINEDGQMVFEANKAFALKSSYHWWKEKAEAFWPDRNSRLADPIRCKLYTAYILKTLVQAYWLYTKPGAWYSVFDESKGLGAYKNNGYEDKVLVTGEFKHEHCTMFFDLAGAAKLLAKDSEESDECLLVSGSIKHMDWESPIGVIRKVKEADLEKELVTGFIIHD